MWRKEDERLQGPSESSTSAVSPTIGKESGKTLHTSAVVSPRAAACVSQGIKIKGEISGGEDLFVDGVFDGKIACPNSTVTLGPNSFVTADVIAREVIVRGRVEGKLTGTQRIQVWRSARFQGELKADRISIEEGAELQGKLEAGKPPATASEERARREGFRKTEANKPKDASKAEDQPASGAAVAG